MMGQTPAKHMAGRFKIIEFVLYLFTSCDLLPRSRTLPYMATVVCLQ